MKQPAYMANDGKARWHSTNLIDWKGHLGRLYVHVNMQRNDGLMGRMGGGWLWKFGILAARTEIVLELFVLSVRIGWHKPQ